MKFWIAALIALLIIPAAISETFAHEGMEPTTFRNKAALQDLLVISTYSGVVYRRDEPVVYKRYRSRQVPRYRSRASEERSDKDMFVPYHQKYVSGVNALQALGMSLANVPPKERKKFVDQVASMPFTTTKNSRQRLALLRGRTVIQNRILSDVYWGRQQRQGSGNYQFRGLQGVTS